MPLPYRLHIVGPLIAASMSSLFAAENQKLSITIYNNDLALIQDVRTLDIVSGRSRIELKDVSAKIRPETVSFSASGVSIVEQNFDFDLLTPAKLMEKAVGQQVQIVRIAPGTGAQVTETATVLSVNNGVVLKVGNHIEVLHADSIPTRVIFSKIPENLRAAPTLSVTVDSERTGSRPATLSYLSTGLSWRADYVALFDEKAGKLDMQGWITLTNNSGTAFTNAETALIAGDINSYRSPNNQYGNSNRGWQSTSASNQSGNTSAFADYHLYQLPAKTTIADQQTKQVGFLEANNVAATKSYRFRASDFSSASEPASADVVIQFSNSEKGGIGKPLPAGVVRAYVRDAEGTPKFIGEDRIDHTPAGTNLGIKTGEAFDVTVQPTQISAEKSGSKRQRYGMTYTVRNARSDAVIVEISQSSSWRTGSIVSENYKSTQIDTRNWRWSVPVKANDEAKLEFTIDIKQ